MQILKVICMALLMFISATSIAQTNAGKDFWMAQVPNLSDKNDDIAIVISNASANPANITITNPTRATITATIAAGTLQTFLVSSDNPNIQNSGVYTSNVWHVTSNQSIVIYNFQPYVNVISNDAALLLPTHALGKKYFIGSYVNATGIPRNSFFSVTATENNTHVKAYNQSGVLMDDYILNQGQCYQRLNGSTVASDMTGWYLESDKGVSLFSGNQCSNIGSGASCDLLVDQVLPLETLASTYIGSPSNTRPLTGTPKTPDLFRFVATVDNTIITFTPASVSAPVTLNKGQYVSITTGTPFVAAASKPVYGYQFFLSQNSLVAGYQRPLTGDPSMMALPVLDQFLYNYNFIIPTTYPYNFVNVVAPVGTKLYIDNVLVTPTWTTAGTVGSVTYQSANVPVTSGRHSMAGDRKYGIVVYGFGDFASYGYLGGSGLEAINAGCITGGPYQIQKCNSSTPLSTQMNGRPSCESGGTPQIMWSSTDGVVFSDPTIANPIATAPGYGTYTVTMTVTCNGNSVICSSDFEVRDTLGGCANMPPPPTLTPPPAVIVPSDAGQSYATNVSIGIATYTASGSATLTNNAPTQFPIGNTTITWTVTDGYGRTASGTQLVTVVPPPTIVPPPAVTVNADAGHNYATGVAIGNATYQSYWEPTTLTNDAPSQYPIGNTTITWTVRDGFNRTASGTQIVTVVSPPPTIIAPDDITVSNNAGETYATGVNLGVDTHTSFVDPTTITNDAPAQFPLGSTTVTWTITDGLGRTASDVQVVTVTSAPPTLTPPPAVTVSNDNGHTYATGVAIGTATYTSSVNPTTLTNDAPAQFPLGNTTVTWTVTDGLGRTASGTQVVTVISAPPTIIAPADITVSNDAGQTYATGVNLGVDTHTSSVDPTTITNDAPAQFPLGSTTVTWTVTDGLGRTATDVQVVTVTSAPPTLTPPPATTVSNDNGQTYATGVALGNATYIVSVNPATLTNDAPAQFPLGNTTVTWTVSDGLGRTASGTQVVTVVSAPPTLTPPPAITVSNNPGQTFATGVALGNAAYTVSVNPATLTNDAPAQFPLGNTTVTWTVSDGLGRTASGTQVVTVVSAPPTIIAPADITVSNNAGVTYATGVNLGSDLHTSSVDPTTVTNDAPAQFPLGSTTVTWTVTDGLGRTATDVQVVTVTSEPPTIVAPPTVTVTAGYNGFASGVNLRANGNETYTASVNPASVTNTAQPQYSIGSTNVTWTVTDGLGRTASDNQVVRVLPPLPTIAPPPNITVSNNPGQTYATGVNLGVPTYNAIGPVTLTNDAPAQFPLGTTTVTWTLTDAYGQTVTTSHTVTVVSAPPTLVPPPAKTVSNNPGQTYATGVSLGTATYTVSVNPATLTNDAPAQFPLGNTTVTWTVSDGLGRTATGTQVITVVSAPPTLIPPPAITVSNNAGQTYATGVALGTATYTSSVNPTTLTNNAPAQFPLGNTTVTWTVTDGLGRTASGTQVVTVVSAPPTIVPPPTVTVNANPGQNYATGVALGNATYTVSVNPATLTNNGLTQFPVGTTTVTWTVTDGLGRTASGTQLVKVVASSCTFTTSITPTQNNCSTNGCNHTSGNCSHSYGGYGSSSSTTVSSTIYLGYGPQTVKLQVGVPSTGGPFTYQWAGSGLSSTTSSAPSFSPTDDGNYTFTVTVKNAAGCTSTSSIKICVIDVRVLNSNGQWDGKKVYVCHLPPGNPPNVQTISISINAVDTHVPNHGGDKLGQCGVICDLSQLVDTLPKIIAPADITVNNNSGVTYATGVALGNATYTALAGSVVTNNAPSQYPIGSTNVTWKVTDPKGRTATDVQTVTVVSPAPTIVAPADKTVIANTSNCSYATSVSLGTATYTVSVNPATVTNNAPSQFPIGNTTVTWKVTDGLGRTATDVQIITVVLPPPPTIVAPPDKAVIVNSGNYATGVALGNATYTVSVNPATVTNNAPSQFPIGNTTVTWKVKDGLGRTATDVQIITVTAPPPPTIVAPADKTITITSGTYATGVTLGNATYTVSVNPATVTNNAPSQFPIGNTTVTWTVKDGLGRTASDVQIITVNVPPPPTIVAPPAKTVTANSGNYATGVSIGTATYTVSVNPATLTNNAPSQYPIGNTTVTWTVKDGLNRTASATQVITVVSACSPYTSTIASLPTSSVYTGGVSTNLYLGYGAQSTKLQVTAPSAGAPYTYQWTGSACNKLSSTTSASPTFTPTAGGSYTFGVIVKNKNGCTSTATITICVKDIRVSSTRCGWYNDDDDDHCDDNYVCSKVYICYYGQTYQVSTSQVSCYIRSGCSSGIFLGKCGQSCGTTYSRGMNSTKTNVPELDKPLVVKASPNPTSNYFILKIEGGSMDSKVDINVVDVLGRIVYRQTTSTGTLNKFGENFTNGVYYAEVMQGNEKKTVKLVKN